MTEDRDDIRRYRDGSMTGAERNALEKKALDDPFLADALEGAEKIDAADLSADVEELARRIQSGKRTWYIPLRIAAGIIVVLAVGSLLYYFNSAGPSQMATNDEKIADTLASISTGPKPDSLLAMAKGSKDKEEIKSSAQPVPASPTIVTPSAESSGSAGASAEKYTADAKLQGTKKTESEKAELTAANQTEQKIAVSADELIEEAPKAASKRKEAVMEPAARSLNTQRTVSGKVTLAEDGTPLPGVNVIIKGTNKGAVTDLHGNYIIVLPADRVDLTYSFIGMETKEVNPGDKAMVNIQLKEDASQLSEVVVTGQAIQREDLDDLVKPVIRLAAPVGGIRAYNKYLETNLRYPAAALEKKIKGKVTITFTITTTGGLTDFNVVRGLGYGCEDEVVRLVKEGPTWTPSLEDDIAVESEVRVKLKFDPAKANK